jgi:hypothetical protein
VNPFEIHAVDGVPILLAGCEYISKANDGRICNEGIQGTERAFCTGDGVYVALDRRDICDDRLYSEILLFRPFP